MGDVIQEVQRLRTELARTTDPAQRVDLLLDLAEQLYYSEPDEARRALDQAVAEARAADSDLLAVALNNLAFLLSQTGDQSQAQTLANEALDFARARHLPKPEASAHNVLGCTCMTRCDWPQAVKHFQECLRISRECNYEGGISTAISNLALVCLTAGDFERAISYYEEALEAEQKRGDWTAVAISYDNLGQCYEQRGQWDRAYECFVRSLAVAERHGNTATLASVLSSLSCLNLKRGRTEKALDLQLRALRLNESLGYTDKQAWSQGLLADIYLAQGELLTARAALERSQELAESAGLVEELARVHWRWARLLMESGSLTEALGEAEQATTLSRQLELQLELGVSLRIKGEIHARRGEQEAARDAFGQAITIFSGKGPRGTGPGYGYELGRTRLSLARLLADQGLVAEAARQADEAARIFRRLSILSAADEAHRFRQTLEASKAGWSDERVAVLKRLSEIATWVAPFSELARTALASLADSFGFPAGALFVYGRQPFLLGAVQVSALLSLPRPASLSVTPGTITIPIRLRDRTVGVLYLCRSDPASSPPESLVPEVSVCEIVSHIISLMTERVYLRAGVPGAEPSEHLESAGAELSFAGMIGSSPAMKALFETIEQVAPFRATVLVRGESGTGKELCARAIHQLSPRAGQAFVALNCAALPETLLEADLFGVEKGTATGVQPRIGRFEQADRGTLFLDEIADAGLATQAKLLRVLEERSFERVGGRRTLTTDVRLIAATHQDLEAAAAAGRFRTDLLHRLNVIVLNLPPLRERPEDIPLLVDLFVRRYSEEFMRPVQAMTSEAMDAVLAYNWPGNVRELENAIEAAVIMARGGLITREDLPPRLQTTSQTAPFPASPEQIRAIRQQSAAREKELVLEALKRNGGRVASAARELGLSRVQLYRLMHRHGLQRERRPKQDDAKR